MEGFSYVDIFATKGIEYLLVIGFLGLLVFFWRFLVTPSKSALEFEFESAVPDVTEWFKIMDGLFYHKGHSWAMPEGDNIVKIGMDDFAQKLILLNSLR